MAVNIRASHCAGVETCGKPTFMEMKLIFLNGRLGNGAGGHR
jgi:hypothetical protein